MRSKKKLFELLALKEKVERNKFFKQAKSIVSEIERNTSMKKQLEAINENKNKSENTLTALQLRSDKWYDFKIQDQISETENRVKFLKKENEQISKEIALRHQKMLKSLEKADMYKKIEIEDLEKKRLLSYPNKKQTQRI